MAKQKTKEVLGVRLTEDGGEWAWRVGDWDWRYAEQRLWRVSGERDVCAGYYPQIAGAVAYSMGYADGLVQGRSQAVPLRGEDSPADPPKAP